jgi:hypothetical protein
MGWTSAHDNAVVESFFASLTKDLLRRRTLGSRAEARTAVFDYIETSTTRSDSTRRSTTVRRSTTRR